MLISQTVTFTISVVQTAKSHLYILYFCLFEKIRSRSDKKKITQGWVNFFFPMLIFYRSKSKLLCEQRFLFCMAFHVYAVLLVASLLVGSFTPIIACSRLWDSRVRWIEKRKHENKTGGNWGECLFLSRLPPLSESLEQANPMRNGA